MNIYKRHWFDFSKIQIVSRRVDCANLSYAGGHVAEYNIEHIYSDSLSNSKCSADNCVCDTLPKFDPTLKKPQYKNIDHYIKTHYHKHQKNPNQTGGADYPEEEYNLKHSEKRDLDLVMFQVSVFATQMLALIWIIQNAHTTQLFQKMLSITPMQMSIVLAYIPKHTKLLTQNEQYITYN